MFPNPGAANKAIVVVAGALRGVASCVQRHYGIVPGNPEIFHTLPADSLGYAGQNSLLRLGSVHPTNQSSVRGQNIIAICEQGYPVIPLCRRVGVSWPYSRGSGQTEGLADSPPVGLDCNQEAQSSGLYHTDARSLMCLESCRKARHRRAARPSLERSCDVYDIQKLAKIRSLR